MKRFLLGTLIYVLIASAIFLSCLTFESNCLNKNYIYVLPENKTTIVVGNSHTAFGVNDSFMTSTVNLSQSGEAYIFTYAKLRKILPLNPNVHTVVLACSEQDITKRLFTLWMKNSNFLGDKIRNFFHLLAPRETMQLFVQNPREVTRQLVGIPKVKSSLALVSLRNKPLTFSDISFGGNEITLGNITKSVTTKTSSPKSEQEIRNDLDIEKMYRSDPIPVSEMQVEYIHKIAELCESSHIRLILLRTPENRAWVSKNEYVFMNFLHTQLPEFLFLDFKNIKYPDSAFSDLTHLAYPASKVFSDTLNKTLIAHLADPENFVK